MSCCKRSKRILIKMTMSLSRRPVRCLQHYVWENISIEYWPQSENNTGCHDTSNNNILTRTLHSISPTTMQTTHQNPSIGLGCFERPRNQTSIIIILARSNMLYRDHKLCVKRRCLYSYTQPVCQCNDVIIKSCQLCK